MKLTAADVSCVGLYPAVDDLKKFRAMSDGIAASRPGQELDDVTACTRDIFGRDCI